MIPPAELLRPDRLRIIGDERPFAWLSCSLLRSGLLQMMSAPAKLLYLHLALAADRRGLSFWGDQRIQQSMGLTEADLQQARRELIELDLLAFDGHTYQLLSLPPCPPLQPSPATIDAQASARNAPTQIPPDARRFLRQLLGRRSQG